MNALTELSRNMINNNTLCCCGIDPDISKFPKEILGMSGSDEEKAYAFITEVIRITAPYVCVYKAQKAFFDCFTGGHDLMKGIVGYAHEQFPGIPVVIDCKIGDTENTMGAYLNNLFVNMDVDGIVVNPYMGDDVLEPFRDFPEKMAVVLVRTSNPGANIIQDIMTASGKKLWEVVLELTINRWNIAGNMVPVISSTAQMDLQLVRKAIPDTMNILFAGVGDQGGDESGVRLLLNSKRSGVFVNSSRGILYAPSHGEKSWQESVKDAVIRLRNILNKYRGY